MDSFPFVLGGLAAAYSLYMWWENGRWQLPHVPFHLDAGLPRGSRHIMLANRKDIVGALERADLRTTRVWEGRNRAVYSGGIY